MNYFSKIVIFLFIVGFSHWSYSQNEGYKIIYDSIYPKIKSDYIYAKHLWKKYDKKYDYDPAETVLFLGQSLANGDVKFYKKEIVQVMKNYGWSYCFEDTLPNAQVRLLEMGISRNNLSEWTVKKSNKYYPKWVKHHLEALRIKDELTSILSEDQSVRRIISDLNDTLTSNYERQRLDSLIGIVDLLNIKKIASICSRNGTMINNFDHGVGTYYRVQLILLHNLKGKESFKVAWDMLFPFLETAYLNGKISYTLFILYDKWSVIHFGYQYYGTQGVDIPINDEETFYIRKQKYKL
jgi:hypothetical protein